MLKSICSYNKLNLKSFDVLLILTTILFGVMFMKQSLAGNLLDTEDKNWSIVNDSVMGGRSKSRVFLLNEQNTIRFEGVLSLKNNGGFASIRSVLQPNYFSDAKQICIDVKGDGRDYQFRLRNSRRFGGYAYVAKFKTQADLWQKICFSPESFIAQYRGRILSNIPPPDFNEIRQLGFMVADKIEDFFRIDIRSIN
jgi:NADH dehydrogenase [ubiquinone] 1 alpha subcomplex assembly factor 1